MAYLTRSFFPDFANSQVGHEQRIIRPRVSKQIDFEGELAVVIGRTSRYISEPDALACLGGCLGAAAFANPVDYRDRTANHTEGDESDHRPFESG
ncbi:MAG: fumarylacetoacetate hydrolase family protein [Bryobacteraceae bacterium]